MRKPSADAKDCTVSANAQLQDGGGQINIRLTG
jgi:hypothetical protein